MRRTNNNADNTVPYASTSTGGVAGRTRVKARRNSSTPNPTNTKRASEPRMWNPYNQGGAMMPRRGSQSAALFTDEAIEHAARHTPLWLIKQLPYLHPSVDMALYTALTLMCPVDGIKIVATPPAAGGTTPDGSVDVNDVDTASLNQMWDMQPAEVGGSLHGLQLMLSNEMILTGMAGAEGVPGPELTGLRRVWPVDALSIAFLRPTRDADLTPYQRQMYPQAAPGAQGTANTVTFGWQKLDEATFKWNAIGQTVDTPEGKSLFSSATNEALCDLALMQDLRDAVHNAAWPRMLLGVDKQILHKTAVEVYGLRGKKATDWVDEQYAKVLLYAEEIAPNQNVVHEATGKVENLGGGNFDGLEGVLSFLRQRVAQSLKTLPTLLGINDGSTFNYTSVEWNIYAQGLETIRQCVASILVDIANLHLRLIGSTSTARAIYEPIRTNDALVAANTEGVTIANNLSKEQAGYVTHDEASLAVTGHKARAEAQPGIIVPMKATEATTGGDASTPPKNAPTNNEQTTQEDRNAKKQTADNK